MLYSPLAGEDYTPANITVTFNASHKYQYIDIFVINDHVFKHTMTFEVVLTLTDPHPEGIIVAPDTAVVDIESDDCESFEPEYGLLVSKIMHVKEEEILQL